jgi:aminoglycoside 3-N-acetyltransferase
MTGESRHSGERRVIERTTDGPITRSRLVSDLRALGVRPGMALMVHSSLSSLGWVVGDSETVVLGLEEAVGDQGTILMPAFSYDVAEPSDWKNPPVPESWWETIRKEWPPFDVRWAKTQRLGEIAETFRCQPGTLRSDHPHLSFAARGPRAREFVGYHSLENAAGEGSPLARLYDADGSVLLLGVGHDSNTSLHLAETRARWPGREKMFERKGRRVENGRVVEVTLRDFWWHEEEFAELGRDFERETREVRIGPVGLATARLMRQRPLVDFGVQWVEKHRSGGPGEPAGLPR